MNNIYKGYVDGVKIVLTCLTYHDGPLSFSFENHKGNLDYFMWYEKNNWIYFKDNSDFEQFLSSKSNESLDDYLKRSIGYCAKLEKSTKYCFTTTGILFAR